jgi:hypothetical protein
MADGSSCVVGLSLSAASPTTLSFLGTISPYNTFCGDFSTGGGTGLVQGQTFAYADRRDALPLGSGSYQSEAMGGAASSSGAIPAISGKTYTVTYYVRFYGPAAVAVPPECSTDQGTWGSTYCELTMSGVFP